MAGHSQFKNIQHRKGAQDKKRAKLFSKLVRDIAVAVKSGGTDIENNTRLRSAIIAARAQNLPKERIDKAISHGDISEQELNQVEIRYEGFAAGGISVIVDATTDNKNRTASDVRSLFSKYGGNLAETGSVSFMFKMLGMIEYNSNIASMDLMLEDVLSFDANDIEEVDGIYKIYTEVSVFAPFLEAITQKYGSFESASIIWKPNDLVYVDDSSKCDKIIKLIENLEDLDDVDAVFTNWNYLRPRE